MKESNQLSTEIERTTRSSSLLGPSNFELAQRMATALSKSTLIPKEFQDNLPNCLIALEMAHRMGASPMMVMQNLYIVHGKPAWSSQFVIAAINSTGRFSPLRFDMKGEGDKRECFAWANELGTGERLEGPPVSMAMAKAEGWSTKNGSKWQTLPELMLRYRAATFFGRLYAPEVLMGMKEESEVIDVDSSVTSVIPRAAISGRPEINGNGGTAGTDVKPAPERTAPKPKKLKVVKGSDKTTPAPTSDDGPPTSEPPAAGPNALEVYQRLQEEKYTVTDLALVCIANKWIDPPHGYTGKREELADVPLESFGEEKLAEILESWDIVADQIARLLKGDS
jgi:hypothetical protein